MSAPDDEATVDEAVIQRFALAHLGRTSLEPGERLICRYRLHMPPDEVRQALRLRGPVISFDHLEIVRDD